MRVMIDGVMWESGRSSKVGWDRDRMLSRQLKFYVITEKVAKQ